MTNRVISPLLAWCSGDKLTNWAGNVEYGTENLYSAKTVQDVQEKLSRNKDGEEFRGAVVGLGALGVITKLSPDIQPRFMMKQYVYQDLPLSTMKEHFDAIESAAYSVSLFTDWQNKRINEVWLKIRLPEEQKFDASAEFFGAKRATRNRHPIIELSAENCTEQMGVTGPWYDRLPHFRMGFTPSVGKELQSEYFVPRQNAMDAILAVERLHDQVTPQLLISEIRTHRPRRPLDEPVLQTAERNHAFHLETRLGGGAKTATDDRKGVGSISGPATLGQAVYHFSHGTSFQVRTDA